MKTKQLTGIGAVASSVLLVSSSFAAPAVKKAKPKSPPAKASSKAAQENARVKAQSERALELWDAKKHAEAVFKKLEIQAPNYYPAALNFGSMLAQLRRWDEAQKQFDRANRLKPNEPWPYLYKGLVEIERHNLPLAEELLQRSRKLAPKSAPPVYWLGEIHRRRGNRTEAERAFRRALELDFYPQPYIHAGAANHLGLLLEVRGQYAQAQQMYRRALEENADFENARVNLERQNKPTMRSLAYWLPAPSQSTFPQGRLTTDARKDSNSLVGWFGDMSRDVGAMNEANENAARSPNIQLIPIPLTQEQKNRQNLGRPPVFARFEMKDAAHPHLLKTSIPVGKWREIELRVTMVSHDMPSVSPKDTKGFSGISTRWLGQGFEPIGDGPRIAAEGSRGLYRIETGSVPPVARRLEIEMGINASKGRFDMYFIEIYVNPVYPVADSVASKE